MRRTFFEEPKTTLTLILDDLIARISSHKCDPECPRSVLQQEKDELRRVETVMAKQAVSLQMRYLRYHTQPEPDSYDEDLIGSRPSYVYGSELPLWFQGLQETAERAVDWLYDRGTTIKELDPCQINFICCALQCHKCDLEEVENRRDYLDKLVGTQPIKILYEEGIRLTIRYRVRRTPEDEEYPCPESTRLVYWPLPVGASWFYPLTNE